MEQPHQIRRSRSLNSVGSNNSHSSTDKDGAWFSSEKQKPCGNNTEASRADGFPSGLTAVNSFNPDSKEKIFKQACYYYPVNDKKFQPVNVKSAESFCECNLNIKQYKNDRNPRGYALIVNNINFKQSIFKKYKTRTGADNDEYRLALLWKQFYYEVEIHRDKTSKEMLKITRNFSKKKELKNADSVIVTFMSHGKAGKSVEESRIVGVDGGSVSCMKIISYFSNKNLDVLNKPKLFFFQACRGKKKDAGVALHDNRIECDGKAVTTNVVRQSKTVRGCSDIFIACPVPPGNQANRDRITGTWFIQTIVDVFAEHAHNTHLEDLMKMVDNKIKYMLCYDCDMRPNFQTLTTKTMGWNKHFFFNPGLARDQKTQDIIPLRPEEIKSIDESEGKEVVDLTDSSPGKSSDEGKKFEQKDDADDDEEEENARKRQSSCGLPSCITL